MKLKPILIICVVLSHLLFSANLSAQKNKNSKTKNKSISGDKKKKIKKEEKIIILPTPENDSLIIDIRDNFKYKTVKIGSQIWMAENLNFKAKKSVCYKDKDDNCKKWGRLYFQKDLEHENICPNGWRIPSKDDFEILLNNSGTDRISKFQNLTQNEKVGFNALLAGSCGLGGDFHGADKFTCFWTNTNFNNNFVVDFTTMCINDSVYHGNCNNKYTDPKKVFIQDHLNYINKYSVRCIKNKADESIEDNVVSSISKNPHQIDDNCRGSFKDSRDNKLYKTIKIGKKIWMAENLDFVVKSISFCYDYKPENCKKFGRLYEWDAALVACPQGWHLPSDDEWEDIADTISSDFGVNRQNKNNWNELGSHLKSKLEWNGIDDYEFNALPSGVWLDNGFFNDLGAYTYFWSSTKVPEFNVWLRKLATKNAKFIRLSESRNFAFSIRCVQNK